MKKELQEKLFKQYPGLFIQKDWTPQQTCMCWGITCGDGWYNIINNLCHLISLEINGPVQTIEKYEKHIVDELCTPGITIDNQKISVYKNIIKNESKKLKPPIQFTQIKEKYGSLRVYTNYHDETIESYIDFAELMSSTTCEICGAPGTINNKGWLKTRCEKHKEN